MKRTGWAAGVAAAWLASGVVAFGAAQGVEKEKGPIAWSDLGAHATQQAKGDGLKVWAEGEGARLRCARSSGWRAKRRQRGCG